MNYEHEDKPVFVPDQKEADPRAHGAERIALASNPTPAALRAQTLGGELDRLLNEAQARAQAAGKRLTDIDAEVGIAALSDVESQVPPGSQPPLTRARRGDVVRRAAAAARESGRTDPIWATYRALVSRDGSIDLSFLDEPRDGPGTGWTFEDERTADRSNYERAIPLLRAGKSQADIARELGCNRSTVHRYAANARAEGRLPGALQAATVSDQVSYGSNGSKVPG
jgi:hypothetical protein